MQVARLFKRHDTYLFGPFEALVLRYCVILMFVNSVQKVVRRKKRKIDKHMVLPQACYKFSRIQSKGDKSGNVSQNFDM